MSEVNLQALADDNATEQKEKKTPIQEVSGALKECGFGLFHVQLLLTTFVVYQSSVLATNSTSYLLPSAECDLHMNLVEKGLLNAMTYVGMIFSSTIAGFLTDTFGRKKFIVFGLMGYFVFAIISASSQSFGVLITSKFCEGVLFACYFTAMITLTSEFCHDGIRDWILILQSSYASIAQVIAALMSWGVLMNDWKLVLFDGMFVLNTWNFYLYLMSLWSLAGCVLYLFIPESPKFLVMQKKYDEARSVLVKIYKRNTRKSEETYVHKDIWKNLDKYKLDDVKESKVKESPGHNIVVALHTIKPLFHRPLGTYLLLICTLNFITMCIYNTFRLWYPQVSTIIEHNTFETSDGGTRDFCTMMDSYTSELELTRSQRNETTVCVPAKSGSETYINSIIIGSVCIIPYFVQGILVAKIGKKPLLLIASLIALGSTLGLRFAKSKVAVVLLFGTATAITQSTMGLYQVNTLEYLPTNVRSLGIGLIMSMGRIGTLAGNILFPVLLEMGCSSPFYTFSGMIMCALLITIFLPTKRK